MSKKYYSAANILSLDCIYSIVFGKRSNGKSYAFLKYALEQYVKSGYRDQFAYVRRWDEDFSKQRAASMFTSLIYDGNGDNQVAILTGGEYNTVYYFSRRWYLAKWDEETREMKKATEPFAYGFSLSANEHDKSTSYPQIKTIIFDEFIARGSYLRDEFILFMNVCSTIIRQRTDVKIFMLGNTINQYCPYFEEMGIDRVRKQKPGTIEVYQMGDSDAKIAVEYVVSTDKVVKGKITSDLYFCFDNPKLKMITAGEWEISIYPHLPVEYKTTEVLYNFFIIFKNDVLHCEVVSHAGANFIYIHQKTSDIKNPDSDLIYTLDYDPRPNWRRRLNRPMLPVERRIWSLFLADKVYYQNNQIGEIVRNYLLLCNDEAG